MTLDGFPSPGGSKVLWATIMEEVETASGATVAADFLPLTTDMAPPTTWLTPPPGGKAEKSGVVERASIEASGAMGGGISLE